MALHDGNGIHKFEQVGGNLFEKFVACKRGM